MNYLRMMSMINESYKQGYIKVNESHNKNYEGNINEICKLDYIIVIDKKGDPQKISPMTIINVVDKAISRIETLYPFLYTFLCTYKIMYVPVWPARSKNTMGVDKDNNLWINMNFVYRDCNMKPYNVFGILFHEMFHIFLSHISRFEKKFDEKSKENLKMTGLWNVANQKANIAMDIEINTSMVADGIVSEYFFTKEIPGQYNKDYVGMTWEEIYDKYGDEEYKRWLKLNGVEIDEDLMKALEAIEKAAKVLKDPTSTDEDKAKARRELQKAMDKFFGRDRDDDIQDALETIRDTRLGDIGDIKEKIQNVIDDLYKSPSKMSDEQYKELMDHIEEMSVEMDNNASEIADTFGKKLDEVKKDIKTMKDIFKNSMEKIKNNKKLNKHDKKEIADKIKDSLEDIMLSDYSKEKLEKKRKERDEKREIEKKEDLKLLHPLRKLINVFKNLMFLGEGAYDLVCKTSHDIMENILNIFEKLTEKDISKINKDDIKYLEKYLSELKDSLFTDLKRLLDNKTILHKTEDDLHKILDATFESVNKSLLIQLPNKDLDDTSKISAINDSVIKLRVIGKILKTQKSWRASEDFYEGVKEIMDELTPLCEKRDFKTLLKKLYDMGVINKSIVTHTFDEDSKKLYNELIKEGKIK